MYLSDIDIKQALDNGGIVIQDFDPERLQPASYDILLGNKFIVTKPESTKMIDPVNEIAPQTRQVTIDDGDEFVLHPGVSVLGITHDFVGSNGEYLIHISGKSSLARIGLIVHNTAGIINPGHHLHITLELANLNNVPIILRPKMEIAQLLFSKLSSPTEKSYPETGRYNGENWNGYVSKNGGSKKKDKTGAAK